MEREDYLDKIDSLTSVIEQFKESYSLKRYNKMSYGKKSLSSRSKQDERKSREEEKMDDSCSQS